MSEYFLQKILKDPEVQENFRRLTALLNSFPIFKGRFQFFEYTLAAPSYPATLTKTHRLGFKPLDIIQTSLIGAGAITWNYSDFTTTTFSLTITGPCAVRFYAGTYTESNVL